MLRASIVFVSVFMVVIRQASAADTVGLTNPATPALKTAAVAGIDASGVIIPIDQSVNVKAGIPTGAYLIHKTAADNGIALTGCIQVRTAVTNTPDAMCECANAYSTTGTAPATTAVTAAPLQTLATGGTTLTTTAQPTVFIWKNFCTAQKALAAALCVDATTGTGCLGGAAAPSATGTGTNSTGNGTVVAGGGAAAPGVTVLPAAGSSTVKGGASMTTPKMAALTIAPLALLAVANFVV